MLVLSLLWVFIGAVAGLLGYVARLCPPTWRPLGWLRMAAIGAVAALLGGWLGVAFFGNFFATSTALWFAILVLVVLPFALSKARSWQVKWNGKKP